MDPKTEKNISNAVRYPIEKLISLDKKDLVQIYRDCWWTIIDESVLFVRGYFPQCNQNESIAKSLQEELYPGLECRLIPVAYIPIKSNDLDYDIPKQ